MQAAERSPAAHDIWGPARARPICQLIPSGRITPAVTLERLLATLAGGAMAMLAALLFWPVWERRRFPGFLAAALVGGGFRVTGLWEDELGLEEVFLRVTKGETQ